MSETKNVQFVIARFEEDLAWLLQPRYVPYLANAIVYNKGSTPITESVAKAVKAVVTLPNVGKNDHTYLYHIVSCLDGMQTLADYTVFFPGSAFTSSRDKLHRMEEIMQFLERGTPIPMVITDLRAEFGSFVMTNYCSSADPRNKAFSNDTYVFPAPVRPFGNWINSILGPATSTANCPMIYRGILCGAKSSIMMTAPSVFRMLLQQCSQHHNPEVGHFIERMWGFLICRGMYESGEVVSMRTDPIVTTHVPKPKAKPQKRYIRLRA